MIVADWDGTQVCAERGAWSSKFGVQKDDKNISLGIREDAERGGPCSTGVARRPGWRAGESGLLPGPRYSG